MPLKTQPRGRRRKGRKGQGWKTEGLEIDTYVDAIDARNSGGARRPRGTLLAWGTSLTKTAHTG